METERGKGRGTGDETNWEGEAPAEPKRQRVASGEWFFGDQCSCIAEKICRTGDADFRKLA
ncbi:MAG: hypothetical protein OGMRLDGQ_003258 [Candidatus Fervidibacter sp.]